jgi:hypothetical protein
MHIDFRLVTRVPRYLALSVERQRASSALLGCGAHSGAILEHIFAGPALDAASRLPDALTPWPAWRDGLQVGVSKVWSAADVEANATVCTWCRVSRLANPPAVSALAFMRGWRWVRPLRQVMQMCTCRRCTTLPRANAGACVRASALPRCRTAVVPLHSPSDAATCPMGCAITYLVSPMLEGSSCVPC